MPATQLPRLGSARWDGVLLTVDTRSFQPVAGSAALVANFDASSLQAAFNDLIVYDGLTGEVDDWREDSLLHLAPSARF